MKIAFFLNSFPVLSQTFILGQITGLIDRGHDVDIYTNTIKNVSVVHSDVTKYNLLDRTFCHGKSGLIIPANKCERLSGAIRILIKRMGHDSIPLYRSLNLFRLGRESASLALLYKTEFITEKRKRYDIIHCHFGPNGILAAKLGAIGAISGKVITTFHGFDVSKYIDQHGKRVYDFLFKKGDLFLPVSHQMKRNIVKLGCNPQKTIVHRMGIDITKFTPIYDRNKDPIKLLTVGRLVEKKGICYGIHAVAGLINKYPKLKYNIVGDGPLRKSLESLITELGLRENVEILGWKRQEEVRELMGSSDIFLTPSVTDRNGDMEGLPVVLMEALASGLPVVSTIHSAIPELVEDGISGFLVPERDVERLIQKLSILMDHPEQLSKMGRAGRSRVENEFNIQKLNDTLVELYHASIKGEAAVLRTTKLASAEHL